MKIHVSEIILETVPGARRLAFAFAFTGLLAMPATAQVFGPGPSDSALFDTVLNLPPDPNIGGGQNIGGDQDIDGNDLTTQVNVAEGGTIGGSVDIRSGGEVNLTGGSIGAFLDIRTGGELNVSDGTISLALEAFSGSFVTITGGNVGQSVDAKSGSTLALSGGVVGQRFDAQPGSNVTITGSRLRLNGQSLIDPLNPTPVFVDLTEGDVLTGALADGSAFIFAHEGLDRLNNVQFVPIDSTIVSTVPIVVDTPNPNRPSGLLAGQTLILRDGGVLRENFEIVDATLNIEGGFLDRALGVVGSVVNMTGGELDVFAEIYEGSTVNISGGSFGGFMDVFSGGELNLSGGMLGSFSEAHAGSTVNISGGVVERSFSALAGSTVNLTGGVVGFGFEAEAGSNVTIDGGEFRLNGTTFFGPTFTFGQGDTFTGTLSDGSSFIFSDSLQDEVVKLNLNQVALPALDTTPQVINTADHGRPSGLRAGQTLTVQAGGVVGDFFETVDGSTLNIEGGTLGQDAAVVNGTVNLRSGVVERAFIGGTGSVVNVSGGSIGNQSKAQSGSEFNFSGGEIGSEFTAEAGSVVNISGGSFEEGFTASGEVNVTGGEFFEEFVVESGGVANISGGIFDDVEVDFDSGSEVNLFGSGFLFNGFPLPITVQDVPLAILAQGSVLSGFFVDGSAFSFDFAGDDSIGDFFDTLLTATQVGPFAGDYNDDGLVNAADYTVWRDSFGSTVDLAADGNRDGQIDGADYMVWRDNFGFSSSVGPDGSAATTVPEPSTLLLFGSVMLFVALRSHKASR